MANLTKSKLFPVELFKASTTRRSKRMFLPFFLVGVVLILCGLGPEFLDAQSQGTPASPRIISSSSGQFSTIALEPISPPTPVVASQVSGSGAALTIIPTFNSTGATSIDPATQTVINNAIAFYQNTFTNRITVNIEFHNMNTGLGQSVFFIFNVPYSMYCTAFAANATSADDATAIANTPCGTTNPINSNANIGVKSPNGRALGITTPEQLFPTNSDCPTPMFTGSGCIGLNVTEANNLGNLKSVLEHEINEVLGLGSALNGTMTPAMPWTEDLFRWHSAGMRSYAADPSNTNTDPCSGTPPAFFSIDGGTTDLDAFNNCNNGGDYGDWIDHTPPQVQDAFASGSGSPSLSVASPEVRALDVIGYSIAFNHFAQVAVWRPSTGQWFIMPRSNPGTVIVQQWGTSTDVPLRGDFDGDGITDTAVWRPSNGTFYVIPSSNPGTPILQQWGTSGDIPVPGDYDGDGKTDFAVFRPSSGTWFIIPSSNPGTPILQQWGTSGDIPVPGDYDGDGKTDFAVFRPSSGNWFIIPSSAPSTFTITQWGTNGDVPLQKPIGQ